MKIETFHPSHITMSIIIQADSTVALLAVRDLHRVRAVDIRQDPTNPTGPQLVVDADQADEYPAYLGIIRNLR